MPKVASPHTGAASPKGGRIGGNQPPSADKAPTKAVTPAPQKPSVNAGISSASRMNSSSLHTDSLKVASTDGISQQHTAERNSSSGTRYRISNHAIRQVMTDGGRPIPAGLSVQMKGGCLPEEKPAPRHNLPDTRHENANRPNNSRPGNRPPERRRRGS
jgi:hypothetical protein